MQPWAPLYAREYSDTANGLKALFRMPKKLSQKMVEKETSLSGVQVKMMSAEQLDKFYPATRLRDGLYDKGPNLDEQAIVLDQAKAALELRALLESFPGFTDNAIVGDLWAEKLRSLLQRYEV